MNKKAFLIVLLINISIIISAQDQLVTNDGGTVNCSILSIDSTRIDFIMNSSGKKVKTYLTVKQITSFTYGGKTYYLDELDNKELNNLKQNRYKSAISFADSIDNLNKNFIITYANKIVFARTIDYEKPMLGTYYFVVDSIKYSAGDIKFYKNETGFYANTKGINPSGASLFSERIRKGKINLYQKETVNYTPGINPTTGTNNYGGGFYSTSTKKYYNIGFGELKKANYNNLYVDLADNSESIKYLDIYKANKNKKNTLYVIGGVSLIGGIATFISKQSKVDYDDLNSPKPNVTGNLIAMGIGAGCFWASYFIYLSNRKHIKKAIDVYNY